MKEAEKHLLETALTNAECVLDSLVDNEVIKGIPVVSTAVGLIKASSDIRDRVFASKLHRFILSLESFSTESKQKWQQKVARNPKEAQKIGETILLTLERLSQLDKAAIIATIFLAYIHDHVSLEDFRRICEAVDIAFIDDLHILLKTEDMSFSMNTSPMMYLARSGLTHPVPGKTYADAGEMFYEATPLGRTFIAAYNNGLKYCD